MEKPMSRKPRRHFTDDFKQQIVDLHYARKKRSENIRAYDLTPSTFDKWLKASTVLSRLSLFIKNNFQHWKNWKSRQEPTFIDGTISAFTVVSITKHLWL